MRGAVSKGGVMPRRPAGLLAGGQGVRSDPQSEGFEEKYRAVIAWGRPLLNRSAKDGIRSSPHCGGEGVTHSPIAPSRYRRNTITRYGNRIAILSELNEPRTPDACDSDRARNANGRTRADGAFSICLVRWKKSTIRVPSRFRRNITDK